MTIGTVCADYDTGYHGELPGVQGEFQLSAEGTDLRAVVGKLTLDDSRAGLDATDAG